MSPLLMLLFVLLSVVSEVTTARPMMLKSRPIHIIGTDDGLAQNASYCAVMIRLERATIEKRQKVWHTSLRNVGPWTIPAQCRYTTSQRPASKAWGYPGDKHDASSKLLKYRAT